MILVERWLIVLLILVEIRVFNLKVFIYTVDSRYLEFDVTINKIRVNRSLTHGELRKYRKCSLLNDEKDTTPAKFWRAKTSIACHDSWNYFKLIQWFCCWWFWSGSASCWKCASINAFNILMKLQKNAFNSYYYI